jgi:YHS domain-containing protein
MNKIIVGIMAVLVLGVSIGWAQEANGPNSSQMSSVQPIEVGNKHCPVSGHKVGEMGPAIKQEYNGKIYNLCCPMCIETFKSDPAKYSKIAEDEVASENK